MELREFLKNNETEAGLKRRTEIQNILEHLNEAINIL